MQRAARIAREVLQELRAVGIPKRLRDAGVTEDLIEPLARQAIEDGCHATNPRKLAFEDFLAGYREAF